MYKLSLEKAKEPEIKLLTFVGSWSRQGSSRKISTSASLTTLKPLTVEIFHKLWKILKEIGIPDHLTCVPRNLYEGQEAAVRTGCGTTNSSKLGKEYVKAVYCHPAYLIYMQYIMSDSGLDGSQVGIKIFVRRNINNLICR